MGGFPSLIDLKEEGEGQPQAVERLKTHHRGMFHVEHAGQKHLSLSWVSPALRDERGKTISWRATLCSDELRMLPCFLSQAIPVAGREPCL